MNEPRCYTCGRVNEVRILHADDDTYYYLCDRHYPIHLHGGGIQCPDNGYVVNYLVGEDGTVVFELFEDEEELLKNGVFSDLSEAERIERIRQGLAETQEWVEWANRRAKGWTIYCWEDLVGLAKELGIPSGDL